MSSGGAVALKVLMADLESDPETRARFYREAQAAAGLLHPNIITIFDAGRGSGALVHRDAAARGRGRSPRIWSVRRPASLERKLDLMIQMCEGLAAAHGAGHRASRSQAEQPVRPDATGC